MTERGTARHRAPTRATTPLTTISTGLTHAVGGGVGTLGRSGAVMAVSTGLVASMVLPGGAAPEQTPKREPQTAPLDLSPASMQLASSSLLTVGAAAGTVSRGGPLSDPDSAGPGFDDGSLSRVSARAEERASRSAAKRAALAKARTVAAVQAAPVSAKPAAKKSATVKKAPAAKAVKPAVKKSATVKKAPAAKKSSSTGTVAPSARGSAVLAIAARYVGIYYRYGGTTPAGFDCSGFTRYVYGQLGVSLPRTAQAQMNAATRVSRSKAKPGDLVFVVGGGTTGHVGIYAGGNMMYDSPRTGKAVSKRAIWTSSVVFGRV